MIHLIPKPDDPSKPNDYEPIPTSPIVSKAMETVVQKQISLHIEYHTLMSNHRHGFRHHKATGNLFTRVLRIRSSAIKNYSQQHLVT